MLIAHTIGQATTATPAPAALTIESGMEIISQMATRLNAAILGGWGDYPIIPQAVAMPEERLVEVGDEAYRVIAWPEDEYAQWVEAWDYLAGRVLQRLGSQRAFPLGDSVLTKKLYDYVVQDLGPLSVSALASLKAASTITNGNDAAIELLVELKRKLAPATEQKKVGGVATGTIVSLLLAALAGGSIIYYFYRKEKSSGASPELPVEFPESAELPEADASIGWY